MGALVSTDCKVEAIRSEEQEVGNVEIGSEEAGSEEQEVGDVEIGLEGALEGAGFVWICSV